MKSLPPGSTIGMLGGGQLGRMTALAAARLGYKTHVFCPEADAPCTQVTNLHTRADFLDFAALETFAQQVDVVTLEWENLPVETLEFLARHVTVHPSADVLRIAQDRVAEKSFACAHRLGTAEFRAVNGVKELTQAVAEIGLPAMLKSTRMGYDGKGQVKLAPGMDLAKAWAEMGSPHGILEAFVDFDCEISVIVARNAAGEVKAYPPVRNVHRNQILAESHAPADIAPEIAAEATNLAIILAEKLDVIGLLAVELFVLRAPDAQGNRVVMNEIAPRPHNSGHWTMDACACGQFEQLVRAVCGLPLGDTLPHSRAVMHNLLGDDAKKWPEFLAQPAACLHLYGKAEARAGRKMGHVNVLKGRW